LKKQEQLCNRALGCLLGGAVGDALGAPVEFSSRPEIIKRFGAQGIRDYVIAYGRMGAITDDTQMTLFTAEGCLRALTSERTNNHVDELAVMRNAYLRWLSTQDVKGDRQVDQTGWLIEKDALFNRRAPGNTCLSALRREGGEVNDSKGCGGIMRVAPCGIIHAGDPDKAFKLGLDAAKLTHGHPTGYLAAAVFAAIIAEVMVGKSLFEAIQSARAVLIGSHAHQETLAALDDAVCRALAKEPPDVAISALGQGWIAEEALAISLYCALSANNLEEGIVTAVNITGDSDSTGAITGNLLGAMAGASVIPTRWLAQLELRDVIETIAQDLILLPLANLQEIRENYLLRYPPR
jgi:ADP-ribosyl-[dinitrogen reductase] hydrolase